MQQTGIYSKNSSHYFSVHCGSCFILLWFSIWNHCRIIHRILWFLDFKQP
ncbi:DUF5348 domain-containing protein [Bizionia myxarmorum]